MTTLSPTTPDRRRGGGPGPAVLAAVLALAVGLAIGWWLGGRTSDSTAPLASPSASKSCPSPTGTAAASGTAKAKPLPAPKTITVNVYNSTNRAGLAGDTSNSLAKRGFTIGKVANDPKNANVAGTAEIRYGPKGATNAKVVAAQVQDPVLVKDTRKDATVDFVLGQAFRSLATPAQVQAALTAPSASPSC